MSNGIIKHFRSDKGFGFLIDTNNDDYFFHISALANKHIGSPVPGQHVTFRLGTNARTGRIQATGVELVEPILEPKPPTEASEAHQLAAMTFMGRTE
jgi:cold shock CspA family protein